MSLEDRALRALRALVKEIKPGGRVSEASKDLKARAERAGVRLMDEVVSLIAQRRVRTQGRKPWEAPEQLEAPRDPRSWRARVEERLDSTVGVVLRPEDVVGGVQGGSEPAPPSLVPAEAPASERPGPRAAPPPPAAAAPVAAAAHEDLTWREAGELTTPLTLAADVPHAPGELPGVTTTHPRPPIAAGLEPDDAATAPLPAAYPGDRLVLVARDPVWAHAYWSVRLSRVHEALTALGGGRGVLRLYDAETEVPLLELETWAERGRYDLRVPWADHAYRVELAIAFEGRAQVLERSRVVCMPPAMPRPAAASTFTTLDAQRQVLARGAEVDRPPRLEVRHAVERAPRSRFDLAAALAVSVGSAPEAFAVQPFAAVGAPSAETPTASAPRPGASEQLQPPPPARSAPAGRAALGASELYLGAPGVPAAPRASWS